MSKSKLIYADGHYVWTGGYNTRHLPKALGFRWDRDLRYWWTDDRSSARRLRKYADGETKARLGEDTSAEVPPAIAAIAHEAVKMLAAVCDGALMLDGQGYSKPEVNIGHYLAMIPELDEYQTAMALKLARIHRGQLPEWMSVILEPFWRAQSVRDQLNAAKQETDDQDGSLECDFDAEQNMS